MPLDSRRTIEALEAMTDPVAFESLCAEILANHPDYSGLVPQGVGRRDGGKDAICRVLANQREATGDGVSWLTEGQVFHFSLRRDLERKVREDLENTRRHGLKPHLLVFVSNRRCTPELQDKLKAECRAQYGWSLEILDQEWLRVRLDTEWQSVRKRYFQIDYDFTVFHNLDRLLQERRRHPNLEDLSSGAYHRRARLHETLAQRLDQHRVALVLGPPGHGKTALARAYAWEWRNADPRREVFYLSARADHDWRAWEQAVHAFDQPHALYIVDDAHLDVEAASQFSNARHDFHQARVLLVSRPLDPSLRAGEEDSYFEHLADHVVEVTAEAEEWGEIVRALARHPHVQGERLGDPRRLLERCEGDLHLLRHLFNAWLLLPAPRPELAAVPETAVDAQIVKRYLGKERNSDNALLVLAAFGQYEIPVETAWLARRPAFQTVLKQGWADLYQLDCYGQPREFADFYHSTPARLLLQAFHRLGRLGRSVESYTLACLGDYLETRPGNAVQLLYDLYRHGQAGMQSQLLTPAFARRMLDVLPMGSGDGLADASRMLYALWRQEGSPEKGGEARSLWPELKKHCAAGLPGLAALGLSPVVWFLLFVKRMDADYHRLLYSQLDYTELGRLSRDVGLSTVRNFLDISSRAGVDKAELRAFCAGLDFADLGRRSRDAGLATVRNFLSGANRAGVDKVELRAFCAGLDFAELGRRPRDVGLATVSIFLDTASRAGVDKAELLAFCAGMDFAELGRRSRDVGLATVRIFLDTASRAGVDKAELRAFCAGLGFAELGRRSRDAGLASIRVFLDTASRAGVDKAELRAFCAGLDFADLGRRSRDAGLSGVSIFLNTASRAGVDKAELRAFCDELDFGGLGQGIQGSPLSTIWTFMQTTSLVGVKDESLLAFAARLDWSGLGEMMRPDESGQRRAYLAELSWAAKNRGIDRVHARAFVAGWGWADILAVIQDHLSPDGLAALLDLLRNRCEFSDAELAARGIDVHADRLWLRAFSEHPGGKVEANLAKVQSRYFAFALLRWDGALRRNGRYWQFLTLRQWNILAHNSALADPARLDSQLWPAMGQLAAGQWTRLLDQADIANLGTFLSLFGPDGCFHDRSLALTLPKPAALAAKVGQVGTLDTAHLLVNIWWVRGHQPAAGLVSAWRVGSLPVDFHQADLRVVHFLAWGAWLSVPAGDWLVQGAFAEAWKGRLGTLWQNREGAVEDWLGAAGIHALSGQGIPWMQGACWFSVHDAENRLMPSFVKPEAEILRRLAGFTALFPGQASPAFRQAALAALRALPARPRIPAYEQARAGLLARFDEEVAM